MARGGAITHGHGGVRAPLITTERYHERVAHPYRTPAEPDPVPAVERKGGLGLWTVVFGLCCAIAGQAVGGPRCTLFATIAGVLLILLRPPTR
jgi:hypothetical protein